MLRRAAASLGLGRRRTGPPLSCGGSTTTTRTTAAALSSSSPAATAVPPLSSHAQRCTAAPPLLLGCVSYDPAVGEIWSGIRDYLVHQCGIPFDYVLFTNYEAQVRALTIHGSIDVAWNGPVAHVMCEELVVMGRTQQTQQPAVPKHDLVSLGMRDVDRDFESVVLVRRRSLEPAFWNNEDTHVLTGARDSPQAHIVPLYALQRQAPYQWKFRKITSFDADLGKHGDTAVGEVQAMQALFTSSSAEDNVAAVVSKMMWERACQNLIPGLEGIQEHCSVLDSVPLPVVDHCQFDAILTDHNRAQLNDFGQALLEMNMDRSPEEARLLKLEGIRKKWVPPRQEGYNIVRSAMGVMTPGRQPPHQPASNFMYSSVRSFSTGFSHTRAASMEARRQFSTASTFAADTPQSVAVVGAGVAGLQAVRALQGHGLKVTAFEAASTVGGLWKSNYQNFGVQVPKQLYEFQDYPMKHVPRGEYPTGPQVQDYVEQYAKDFDLRKSIQFNTKVTSVQPHQKDNKMAWTVETKQTDGTTQKQVFDYLVVATGLYSNLNKYIPVKPGQDKFPGDIVHSSDLTDVAAMVRNKKVVVVGSGKSAIDCAIESATTGGAASVILLQRTAHWPTPQKIAGLIPFQYIFLSRFGTALVSAHRGTFPNGSGSAVNAFRNSVIGPLLMRPVFGIVEALFAFQFGLSGNLRPKKDVVTDFYGVALVLNSDLKNLRKAGKVNVQLGEIEKFNESGAATLADGSTLDADVVVCATGFEQNYSLFTDPNTVRDMEIESDGMYLYRYILPEKVPNLAFIGHMAAISNISSYGLQAEWLARKLTGKLAGSAQTPSAEKMQSEIEAHKQWARSWMPESSTRGMNVLLHQTHYHDQLLKDMGLNPHRKSNVLSEYLMPYESADYDGIMAGSSKRSDN